MANTISAIKRIRQTERKTAINRQSKTRLRHTIRTMQRLLAASDADGAQKALPRTFSIIDRSAKLGVIKKNTASRYKSRLHSKVKALTAK